MDIEHGFTWVGMYICALEESVHSIKRFALKGYSWYLSSEKLRFWFSPLRKSTQWCLTCSAMSRHVCKLMYVRNLWKLLTTQLEGGEQEKEPRSSLTLKLHDTANVGPEFEHCLRSFLLSPPFKLRSQQLSHKYILPCHPDAQTIICVSSVRCCAIATTRKANEANLMHDRLPMCM